MLLLDMRVQISHQRYADFVREAERKRLIRAVQAARPRGEQAAQHVARWPGMRRHHLQAPRAAARCCTPALCC